MNSGTYRKRHGFSEGHEKDIAFMTSLRTETTEQLAKLRRHYKKNPWRVVAIDRELNRRQGK